MGGVRGSSWARTVRELGGAGRKQDGNCRELVETEKNKDVTKPIVESYGHLCFSGINYIVCFNFASSYFAFRFHFMVTMRIYGLAGMCVRALI